MIKTLHCSRVWSLYHGAFPNGRLNDPINDPINDTTKPSVNTKDDGTSIWIFKNGASGDE